jgi:signal transduction histidine kinase
MVVSAHPFISHFPAAQGALLAKQVRFVRYPHRAVIFEEDDASDSIYLVLTGRVALTKKNPGGAPQIIAYKGPADYFGELGVLDGSGRSTAAIADGPVHLGRIDQEVFLKILSESSWHTVLRLFSHVSENLRATNARYVTEVVRKEKLSTVGEMANAMIHDFRGPFTTISLATESLAQRNADPRTQELCAMILRQVGRLGGMVEEVLEFARGETRLKLRATSLREVFAQLRENNAATFARTQVRLVIRESSLSLLLDPDRFQRVLQNLVTNAREALAHQEQARITVAVRVKDNRCLLTVRDNGPGIPREIRETLFEPFVSHGKSGGTGLGLAIARSVVEAHQGLISYRTSRTGTVFTIQLPLMP